MNIDNTNPVLAIVGRGAAACGVLLILRDYAQHRVHLRVRRFVQKKIKMLISDICSAALHTIFAIFFYFILCTFNWVRKFDVVATQRYNSGIKNIFFCVFRKSTAYLKRSDNIVQKIKYSARSKASYDIFQNG